MLYEMYPSWCNPNNSTGSAIFGERLMVIQTRWHEHVKPNTWNILMSYRGHYMSFDTVMDDFGDLVPVRKD